jgi:glycosyltransferase involved in cell wall biosynthesis
MDSTEGKLIDATSVCVWEAAMIVSEFKPDVVHLNDRQTYLAFRYFDNLIYSKHLLISDLFGLKGLNDVWFQELKIERAVVENSKFCIVYSEFMRQRVYESLSHKVSAVILPLGIDVHKYAGAVKSKDEIIVSYFGRFEDIQKGFHEYVRAVNSMDPAFVQKHKIKFRIYGKGQLPKFTNESLYDLITFVDGDKKYEAYKDSHIVIMPSRYEPFGYVGLEALAAGCALLVTQGLGMDEFLTPDNHIGVMDAAVDIHQKLCALIENPEKLADLHAKAAESVQQWTTAQSIKAHQKVYQWSLQEGVQDRAKLFSKVGWNQLQSIAVPEDKASGIKEALASLVEEMGQQAHYMGAGAALASDIGVSPEQIRVPGQRTEDMMNGRLEFLPYNDGELENVVVCGGIEVSYQPPRALAELLRVTKKTLLLILFPETQFRGQTLFPESKDDWKAFLKENVKGVKKEYSDKGSHLICRLTK